MTEHTGHSGVKRRWGLIGVRSAAGARRPGQDRAPTALRGAGLLERLAEYGADVVDIGDSFECPFEDPSKTGLDERARRVSEVVREVERLVDAAKTGGLTPLVLGGDCTITLGVLAALRRRTDIGLAYVDADLDLNTPDTSPSGAFDGMGLAHAFGLGDERVTGRSAEDPLLHASSTVVFGYDVDSGWIDPPEVERLASLGVMGFPLERVRGREAEAAREAVTVLEGRAPHMVVHFDVDVTSLASADVPHPNGLELEAAAEALAVFVHAPACAAVVVTEFNPESDPDGSDARRLANTLALTLRPPRP